MKKPTLALIFGLIMALAYLILGKSMNETFWGFIGSFFGALIALYILYDDENRFKKL